MTFRERASLALTAAGGVQLVAAAYGYGGWRAAAVVNGVLAVGVGLLLGVEVERPAPAGDGAGDGAGFGYPDAADVR